jgi:hypothetical protein
MLSFLTWNHSYAAKIKMKDKCHLISRAQAIIQAKKKQKEKL